MLNLEKLSQITKNCFETGFRLPRAGDFNESSDVFALVTRKTAMQNLYKQLFEKESYESYVSSLEGETTLEFGDVHIGFERNEKRFRFSNKTDMILICTTETETDVYQLVIPLFSENVELFLFGIVALAEPTMMLDWSEYKFISKSKTSSRENKIRMKFSYSLEKGKNNDGEKDVTPEEYFVMARLEDSAFRKFEKLNIARLQEKSLYTLEMELLRIWSIMHVDCFSQNNINIAKPIQDIKIFDEWYNFEAFKNWSLVNGFTSGKIMIRTDELLDYNPENVIWTDKPIYEIAFPIYSAERYYWHYFNGSYYRTMDLAKTPIRIHGETKSLYEWSQISDVPTHVIIGRVYSGLKDEELIAPLEKQSVTYLNKDITIDGVTKTAKEWAEFAGITPNTIVSRLRYGWTGKDLITPPRNRARE